MFGLGDVCYARPEITDVRDEDFWQNGLFLHCGIASGYLMGRLQLH